MNDDGAHETVTRIEKDGGRAIAVQADVSRRVDCDGMVQTTIDEYGRLDVLYNNAAIQMSGRLAETTEAMWDITMATNLTAIFRACRAAIPHMLAGGGGSVVGGTTPAPDAPGSVLGLSWADMSFSPPLAQHTVTQADVDYEGSITIDRRLMDATDLLPNEAVCVWNVTNGNRFETYAVEGPPDSGVICVNGAAAHLVRPGDLVIIAAYTWLPEAEARAYEPKVVFVDERNRMRERRAEVAGPMRAAG